MNNPLTGSSVAGSAYSHVWVRVLPNTATIDVSLKKITFRVLAIVLSQPNLVLQAAVCIVIEAMNTSSELFDGSCAQDCRSSYSTPGARRLYPDRGKFQSQSQILDSSFLLPLNGQIYDVSNLAPSSCFRRKKPPPGPPRTPKKKYDSSLYPQDWNELLYQMEHANESSLDRLKLNWTTCNRRRHTFTDSSLSTAFPMHQDFADLSSKRTKKKEAAPPPEEVPQGQGYTVIRRNSSPDLPYPSMMSMDASTGFPLIALGGQNVPFYGAKATAQAICEGRGWNTFCQGCRAPLTCMIGITYVICPLCQTIGPAKPPQYNRDPANSTSCNRTIPPSRPEEEPASLCAAGIGLRQAPKSRTTAFAPLSGR